MASLIANATVTVVVLGWLLLMSLKAVTVDVTPHVAFAPAFVRVLVRVQPNAENRSLAVEADGPMYRSSVVPMEGADAPIVYWVEYPALDAGEYAVRASVANSVKHVIARDQTTLKVVGRGE